MSFLELWYALNDFIAELMNLDIYEIEVENENEAENEII